MSCYHQLSQSPTVNFDCDLLLFQHAIWKDDYITLMQSQLNDVCLQLEDKDGQEWSRHTSRMDESSWILPKIRDTVNPELLTRAWLKMRELLSKFNLLADCESSENIYGLFLCEAPGAFITSTNHWIKERNAKCKLHWKACTLNPYHESLNFSSAIFDDRLYKETSDNWLLSPEDNTGNIMQCGFVDYLRDTLSGCFENGFATFVTADGGVSCLDEPENQEINLLPLIFAEMILALNSLSPGGFFVLKVFSLFHCNSICLCFYLSQLFDHVHIAKPITSKAGNCELYLVCIGFRGTNELIHRQLIQQLTNGTLTDSLLSKCMFPRDIIPLKFIVNFQQAITLFTHKQKSAIVENLRRFNVDSKQFAENLIRRKKHTCHKFFHLNVISPISKEQYLIDPSEYRNALSNFLCHPSQRIRSAFKYFIDYLKVFEGINFCQGALRERRTMNPMMKESNLDRIDSLCSQDISPVFPVFQHWYSLSRSDFDVEIVCGPKLDSVIRNSKFVSAHLLNIHAHIGGCGDKSTRHVTDCLRDDELDGLLCSALSHLKVQGVDEVQVNLRCERTVVQVSSHFTRVVENFLSSEATSTTENQRKPIKSKLHIFHIASCCEGHSAGNNFTPLPMDTLLALIQWISSVLSTLQPLDILGISVDHSLDRLTASVIYFVCNLFGQFTVLPRSNNWFHSDQSFCGQIFLFRLQDKSLPLPDASEGFHAMKQSLDATSARANEFSSHLNVIYSHLTRFKCLLDHHLETLSSNRTILQLISVPIMLKDDSFYPVVYCANGVTLVHSIRRLRGLV